MESFWKTLCDIKMMPLTTEQFPKINEKFVRAEINVDMKNMERISENLALRLS